MLFGGDLKEVRGGKFEVFFFFYNDCIFIGALVFGFRAGSENVERVYVEHIWAKT